LFWNKRSINNDVPNPSIDRMNKDFHFDLPKLIVNTAKHMWSIDRCTFNKRQRVLNHFSENMIIS